MKARTWVALAPAALAAATAASTSNAGAASGASDWLLAVGASYGAVLLGGGAGVLAGFWPRLTLGYWLLAFAACLSLVIGLWQPTNWALAAWVLGLTTLVSGGAFGVLRWLVRRRRAH